MNKTPCGICHPCTLYVQERINSRASGEINQLVATPQPLAIPHPGREKKAYPASCEPNTWPIIVQPLLTATFGEMDGGRLTDAGGLIEVKTTEKPSLGL